MKSWSVNTIPNPLDINIFKPLIQNSARKVFNLPLNKKIILFGSMDGTNNKNKGWDLLSEALISQFKIPNSIAVVFGQSSVIKENVNMPICFVGKLVDPQSLAVLYSAADVTVVPSKFESFGQTASESTSCGTP